MNKFDDDDDGPIIVIITDPDEDDFPEPPDDPGEPIEEEKPILSEIRYCLICNEKKICCSRCKCCLDKHCQCGED